MAKFTEAEIEDLKARHACDELARQWVTLRRAGSRQVGACPICSSDPTSRTATRFEADRESWKCAVCCDGGDVIRLVQKVNNCEFVAAVEYLGGTREIDPAEAARAAAYRAEQRAAREREASQYRERERRKLWEIWQSARAIADTPAAEYLSARGVALPISSARLRYLANCPMYADGSGKSPPVHHGPVMLAAIVGADGRFCGLHFTWIDLKQPKGKAIVKDPATGEILPAKKVRGSKAGGHIELIARSAPQRLVIGEGIETVGSVAQALGLVEDAAFWTSVDLGNLGGRAAETVKHPSLKTANGRAQRVPGPLPDLNAPAIPIPDCVEELVLLADADSDRFTTQCKLACAAARYAKAGRTIKVAWPADGADFNDMLRQDGGAAAIAALVATAGAVEAPAIETNARARARTDHSADANVVAFPAAVAPRAARPPAAADFPAEISAPAQMGGSAPKNDGRSGAGQRASARRGADRADLSPADKDDLDLRLAFFPQTDLGNAERFRERYRGRLLWCAAIGWLYWDGRRWSRDGADERAKRAAHETVRAIMDEADALVASGQDHPVGVKSSGRGKDKEETEIMYSDTLRAWARDSESNSRLNQLAEQADAYLAIPPDRLDADPFKVSCLNGTLRVRKTDDGSPYINFTEHDPADLITKLIPVDYDAGAPAPRFDQFLVDVQPKPEMRRFLQQWLGLSLTADVGEQKLCVWYGKGKNGKSVLMDTVAHVAGDYSETVPIETFLSEGRSRNGGQATPDLAILPGVRMLRTSEPKRNATLDEALIKLATGGEPMQVRHLNRDYFKFYPQFKLTIQGNYRPKIEGTDEGIWRRVILVPWSVTISEEKRDQKLASKLREEGSGILNRLLEGLCDWLDHGLIVPDDALAATADYRSDSDPLGRFLEACVEKAPGERVQATVMHELFIAWARANATTEWSPKGLTLALKERGVQAIKSNVHFWLDIRLTRRVSDFVDAHGKPIEQRSGGADDAAISQPASADRDDMAIEP